MAQFPFTHADIMALAGSLLAGLTDNPAVYPVPAVDLADFQARIDSCTQARAALTDAIAVKEMATTEHQKQIAGLKDMMRQQLRYAENTTGFDDDKLKLLGWAGKREKTATVPGQVRSLRAIEQGTDFVVLSWMSPADGGRAGVYQIFRRDERASEAWIHVGVSMATTAKLLDQPRHVDMEYRVAALNKTGQGPMSNTVAVVL